jgi:hypothetical protein
MICRNISAVLRRLAFVALCCGATGVAISIGSASALAQKAPGAVTDPQDINGKPGVVMEITQCKRQGNMLSIRLRLRNAGTEDVTDWDFMDNNVYIDQFYVLVANKKYLVLRDTNKVPLATPGTRDGGWRLRIDIPKGSSYTWYGKYPAPPPDVKMISFYTSYTPPFEDVPVSE